MSSYYTNGTMVLGKTYLIRRKRRKTVQNIQKDNRNKKRRRNDVKRGRVGIIGKRISKLNMFELVR